MPIDRVTTIPSPSPDLAALICFLCVLVSLERTHLVSGVAVFANAFPLGASAPKPTPFSCSQEMQPLEEDVDVAIKSNDFDTYDRLPSPEYTTGGGMMGTPPISSLVSDGDESAASEIQDGATRTLRPPLRFSFSGYSVWLDLDQAEEGNDLDAAMVYAAESQGVHPIPAPHVTVIYGMDHLDAETVRERFRSLGQAVEEAGGWPRVIPNGMIVDKEYAGINGGEMTMAWMEISLKNTPEHERLVDAVHSRLYGPSAPRKGPWIPHLSLCYDNPEGSSFNLAGALNIVEKFPTLVGYGQGRKPKGLSLWRTEGTMDQWKHVDTINFDDI